MRAITILLVVLLGACAGPQSQDLVDRPPSLAVAQAALSGGAPAMALQICTETVNRQPRNLEAQICVGDALTALGRDAEATVAFEQAQIMAPDDPGALMGLGRLRLATDAPSAELLFLRVLSVKPGNALAWNNVGIARDLQGRHQEAQVAYGKALGLMPSLRAAEVNLALSMAMSGQAEEAVRRLRSIAADPTASPRLRQDLAAALAMADQPDEAARLLRGDLNPSEIDQAISGYRALSVQPAK